MGGLSLPPYLGILPSFLPTCLSGGKWRISVLGCLGQEGGKDLPTWLHDGKEECKVGRQEG
jgi:hypothetical protein